jgi:hypothetical protein
MLKVKITIWCTCIDLHFGVRYNLIWQQWIMVWSLIIHRVKITFSVGLAAIAVLRCCTAVWNSSMVFTVVEFRISLLITPQSKNDVISISVSYKVLISFGQCTHSPLLPHGATTLSGPRPLCQSFTIALRHTTLGETYLDKWSARLETSIRQHTTVTRKTSMSPARFETTISAVERPQTHALDGTATGMSTQ